MATNFAPGVSGREKTTNPGSWSWADALAAARPGVHYRASRIFFSMVRDRFSELGFSVGDEFVCTENTSEGVVLRRFDGRRVRLEREYAWFVEVEPVEARADA